MNKARLLVCPSCSRHVRASESACPFCDGSFPASLSQAPAPRAPARRLSRAALYAFGASSLGLGTACSGSSFTSEDASAEAAPAEASPGDVVSADRTGFQPPYGAPPSPDGATFDVGSGQPLYGAPFDASLPIGDGGPDHLSVQPLYGASFDASIPAEDARTTEDGAGPDARAVAAYGAPGLIDAAGREDVAHIVPLYGAPVMH